MKCQSSGELKVLKEINISDMDAKDREGCLREAKILEILKHDFIVGFSDVFKTKAGRLCIVMEYCENGDLDKEISRRRDLLE